MFEAEILPGNTGKTDVPAAEAPLDPYSRIVAAVADCVCPNHRSSRPYP